jgi:hypothetical protein
MATSEMNLAITLGKTRRLTGNLVYIPEFGGSSRDFGEFSGNLSAATAGDGGEP